MARIEANLGLIDPALASRPAGPRPARRRSCRGEMPEIAESRVLLGDTQQGHGDLDQARATLERALAETLAARGADSLEVAEARRSLAGTPCIRPEDRARAVDLLRQALATFRRDAGRRPTSKPPRRWLELGAALEAGERYTRRPSRLYREALARLQRALGPRHPKVAAAQTNLAGLLDRLSRPAEARELFEQAIATQRATLGPHHHWSWPRRSSPMGCC